MVVFGQGGRSWAKVVLLGQKVCIWEIAVVFEQMWLYSGKSGCIRAKWLYLGKSRGIGANVVVLGQKMLYSGEVVVFGRSCCIRDIQPLCPNIITFARIEPFWQNTTNLPE